MSGARARRKGPAEWEDAPDEELLGWRICDLGVRLKDSVLEERITRLYGELDARGLRYHPPCYLTTEWLCPDRVPVIGIPFFLAHPRLQQLELNMMLEVEGGTENDCMKLMRHEAGHAINYAYLLYRRSRWRELFGPMSTEYNPHEYYMHPYSRQFVIHLRDNYAQAHPDEDFAETFAVWLTPEIHWREKYRGWAALKKLEYVYHLMNEIGSKQPAVTRGELIWPLPKVRATLESYYKRKRKEFADAYRGFYDPVLLELFSPENTGYPLAARFLSSNRRNLRGTVAHWALVHKYAVDEVIRKLAQRCRDLKLYLRTSEEETLFQLGVCIASLVLEARERYLKQREEEES